MSVLNNYMVRLPRLPDPRPSRPSRPGRGTTAPSTRASSMVNGLKAWFGENATAENEFGYGWLPKKSTTKDYSLFGIFDAAYAGKVKVLWVLGQNPMVTNPNLSYVHEALSKLDFLVVQELWETETAAFWQRPAPTRRRSRPRCCSSRPPTSWRRRAPSPAPARLVQWRYAGVKPPGEARADIEVFDEVFRRVRDAVRRLDRPEGRAHPEGGSGATGKDTLAEDVLKEINGRAWKDLPGEGAQGGRPRRRGSPDLQGDGCTSSGVVDLRGLLRAAGRTSRSAATRRIPTRPRPLPATSPGPGRAT